MNQRFLFVVALTALAVTSCSSSTPQSQSTSPATTTVSEIHIAENLPATPFTDFLFGPSDKIHDKIAVSQHATEQCMRAAGWDSYVGFDAIVGAPPRDKAAFGTEFFYGVTTRLDFVYPGEDQTVNPNIAFIESLSATERDALDIDLWSQATSAEYPKLGCMYVGLEAGFGNRRLVAPRTAEIQAQLDDEVYADPEYISAEKAWSACMAAAGHPYDDDGGAIGEVAAALQDLAAQLGRPPKDADARAAGLQDLEERLFWVDMDCRASTDHAKRITAVRQRIEGGYLEAHPDLAEELSSEVASPTT
jgi:hypothetical protein